MPSRSDGGVCRRDALSDISPDVLSYRGPSVKVCTLAQTQPRGNLAGRKAQVMSETGKKYATVCPACGSAVNPGSYRCPRCKIYFCVRCGRHLRKRIDSEFLCRTPECPYFNRIVCLDCIQTVKVEVALPPRRSWIKRLSEEFLCALFHVSPRTEEPRSPQYEYRCLSCGELLVLCPS